MIEVWVAVGLAVLGAIGWLAKVMFSAGRRKEKDIADEAFIDTTTRVEETPRVTDADDAREWLRDNAAAEHERAVSDNKKSKEQNSAACSPPRRMMRRR
jgi:hypothetical protein